MSEFSTTKLSRRHFILMDLSHLLQQLGFNEKESAIYLACLKQGQPTVLQLSRSTKIPRGSVYDALEDMLEKGYVNQVEKDKHRIFMATSPKTLYKEYRAKVKQFSKALPELTGLFHGHEKPAVRFFEGIEGIKHVYEDSLKASTEILNFTNSAEVRTHWPSYDQDYIEKRIKKKIFLRCIAPDDAYGHGVQSEDEPSFRQTLLVPSQEFSFTNEINIYDHKMTIVSFDPKPIGIIIESQPVADTQRDIFKMAWAFAWSLQNKKNLFEVNPIDDE